MIVPQTGQTERLNRFPPVAPTEQLSQASAPTERIIVANRSPSIALRLIITLVLIWLAATTVVALDSHAFAVVAAFGVAGAIWLAFGENE